MQQTHCPEFFFYKHEATHADSNFFHEQSCTYVAEIQPLTHTAEFCASPTDNSTTFSILELGTLSGNQQSSWLVALLSVSLNLGPSLAINSLPGWFLAGLFTFLSRLRARGRNCFKTTIMTTKIIKSVFSGLSFVTICKALKCGPSHTYMNNRKPVLQSEIDVGSELPLTSFNVTHHGLAELSKLICSDNRLCTPTSERHRLSNRVRDCLKPIIRMHPVAPIWNWGGGGLSNCMRGFTLHQKLGFLFTCYPCMSLLRKKKKKKRQ